MIDVSASLRQLDTLDMQRLGLLLLACADMSKDHYVLLRYSARDAVWRVNVRLAPDLEHTASSQRSPLEAMDRACQWLRSSVAQRGV